MPHAKHLSLNWKRSLFATALLFSLLFIIGCGGVSGSSAGNTSTTRSANTNSAAGGAPVSPRSKNLTDPGVPQYLIKTLKVGMGVKDTTKVADILQAWIAATDIRSSSAGITYDQAGDSLYNISLTFSVQSSLYPQIALYLRDYAAKNGGQLLSLNETVQDVGNDFIDTQSRLTNLRTEQTRLLNLLGHAQVLGDVITIQDKLTEVEGQLETIQAHLKQLNGQISFYTVIVTLQPLATVVSPPPSSGWSLGQTFHDAFAASLGFAQGLLTFVVWLLAYSFYIIPLGLLAWVLYRWRKRSRSILAPAPILATAATPSVPTATPHN